MTEILDRRPDRGADDVARTGGGTTADPDVIARATALVPLISELAEKSSQERRVVPEVVTALQEAGLFGLLVPRRLGGLETNLRTMMECVAEVARGDGSTAWALALLNVCTGSPPRSPTRRSRRCSQARELCPAAVEELVKAEMVLGPSLVNEDPPLHARRRPHVRNALVAPRRIEEVRPRIRDLANRYIDAFVRRGHADLVADFAWEIPALVAPAIMGVPDEDVERAKEFSGRLALFTWGYPSDEEQTQLAAGMGSTGRLRKSTSVVGSKSTDDYISELITSWRAQSDEELFDENYLVTTMMNFLFAGHETTTDATANGMLALLENGEQWDALCADPSLAPNAVEESLRHSSPVIAWRRGAVRDAVIAGVTIPAGSKVLAVIGSSNHNESVFPSPETFDITRANARKHFAFGSGRHLCLGAPLARVEMQIFFEELSRRLPLMRLVTDQTHRYSPNTSFRAPDHLLVEWDVRNNPVAADRA